MSVTPRGLRGAPPSFQGEIEASVIAPGTQIDEFEVVRFLGQGGMGQVYLARDVNLGRKVALKLIRSRHSGRLRFFQEARTTARFSHPNIVTVYSFGEFDRQSYLALEYLSGQTLRQRIKDADFSPQERLRVARDIASAMAEAHDNGLLHLDLKPDNVMLTREGRTKVLDFGLSQSIYAESSANELEDIAAASFEDDLHLNVYGTPSYMAPEQWLGRRRSSATDVWAFGVILYELMQERRPWTTSGKNPMDLAKEICLGPTVRLSKTASGLESLGELVGHCLAKVPSRRTSATEIVAQLDALIGARQPSKSAAHESPFRGLRAFTAKDTELFFGRTQEINELMERLRTEPFLAVVGASGTGKSSLIHAGIVPRLSQAGWSITTIRPGASPFKTLAFRLVEVAHSSSRGPKNATGDTVRSLAEKLEQHPHQLSMLLAQRARKQGRQVLIVDQFEELYTMVEDVTKRQAFIRSVALAADDPTEPVRVLIAVRGDFLSRMAEASAEVRQVLRQFMLLQVPGRAALIETLVTPLKNTGYRFDPGLAEQMVDDADKQSASLPLLQFTAQRLWEERDEGGRRLTQDAYDRIGGVSGALIQHGDRVLDTLGTEDTTVARNLLLRMVTSERTRRVVLSDEVVEGLGPQAQGVLDALVAARLVTTVQLRTVDGVHSAVELAHESLINNWARLRDWVEDKQDELSFLTEVREAAELWIRRGRVANEVWTGEALREALRKRDKCTSVVPSSALAFIEAGQLFDQRRARQKRNLVMAVILGLTVASSVFFAQRQQALQNQALAEMHRAESESHRTVAEQEAAGARNASRLTSATLHRTDPTLVLSLIREMEPEGALPAQWRELAQWALYQPISETILPHETTVSSSSFHPDGTRIATTSWDRLVRVWNTDGSGTPLVLKGHQDYIYNIAFSPDGTRLVTASHDKTVRVWNADGSGSPLVLKGHEDYVFSASFNFDSTRIVSASGDKTIRVWPADGASPPLVLRGHEDRVYWASFSKDGTRIVSASHDKTARVWNVDGSGAPLVLRGHEDRVYSVAISPDGTQIVTVSADKTVRIWNADGSGAPRVLRGHKDAIVAVAFSPDGTRFATASADKTIRIWNLERGTTELILKGHEVWVTSVVFTAAGTHVATTSHDKTTRIWNVDTAKAPVLLRGHRDRVVSAVFNPDDTRIVTTSWDKTARVWDLDGTESFLFKDHEDVVYAAAFSPDGSRIVTASWDQTARIWNADGSGTPLVFRGHQGRVYAASFSPDGTQIVTGAGDKEARVWNADGSGEPLVLRGHQGRIYSASFSPDGTRVVTASLDKTARVWSLDGSGTSIVLKGHKAPVWCAAFSPDGTRVMTGSIDKTVRIWRLDQVNPDGSQPFVELKNPAEIYGAGTRGGQGAFSPDGRRVLLLSADHTIRIWNTDEAGEPAVLRIPELDPWSAAFSSDGTRIITGSHQESNPAGDREYWATIWPTFEQFSGLDDPALWTPTRYCPPVELRVELLGVSAQVAEKQRQQCLDRVQAALQAN